MKKEIKEDITEIIMFFYRIPGQYLIASMILFVFWKGMRDLTNLSLLFFIFGLFFIFLEIISPILAGKRLYDKFRGWLK